MSRSGVIKCTLMEMAYRVSVYKDTSIVDMDVHPNYELTTDFFEKNSDLKALVDMLTAVLQISLEDE